MALEFGMVRINTGYTPQSCDASMKQNGMKLEEVLVIFKSANVIDNIKVVEDSMRYLLGDMTKQDNSSSSSQENQEQKKDENSKSKTQ